jgi:hypothetical protein
VAYDKEGSPQSELLIKRSFHGCQLELIPFGIIGVHSLFNDVLRLQLHNVQAICGGRAFISWFSTRANTFRNHWGIIIIRCNGDLMQQVHRTRNMWRQGVLFVVVN